jgi:hypothetical protein
MTHAPSRPRRFIMLTVRTHLVLRALAVAVIAAAALLPSARADRGRARAGGEHGKVAQSASNAGTVPARAVLPSSVARR